MSLPENSGIEIEFSISIITNPLAARFQFAVPIPRLRGYALGGPICRREKHAETGGILKQRKS